MKTQEYRTRTIFNRCSYPVFTEKYWPFAVDFGYSSVKGINRNSIFCFPSYACKMESGVTLFRNPNSTDIYYKDCATNELWAVGANAQALVSIDSSNDSSSSLYGRNRYFSDMFKVVARVGLGLGIAEGLTSGKHPVIQTGLPPAYLKTDAPLLKEALSGHHSFDVKVGNGNWIHYEFDLTSEDIRVMPQPMGTLISISTANNGLPSPRAEEFFKSRLLICDPGFGTFDTYYIQNGAINRKPETFDNLGMRQVLQNTSDSIYREYGVEINVSAMQKYLETGYVTALNRQTMHSDKYPFDTILETESKKVCMQAMEKIKELYNYLIEVDFLVITGGTGAAWSGYIRDYLSGMNSLEIISGNMNDSIPYIFSNVRGYFMYLTNALRDMQ